MDFVLRIMPTKGYSLKPIQSFVRKTILGALGDLTEKAAKRGLNLEPYFKHDDILLDALLNQNSVHVGHFLIEFVTEESAIARSLEAEEENCHKALRGVF